jgi:SAM-dependent methyltransferase
MEFRSTPELKEYTVRFESLRSWLDWLQQHLFVADRDYIAGLVARACAEGVDCRFLGRHVPPPEVRLVDDNYRESLLAAGLNPRQRAVLDILQELTDPDDPSAFRIFAPEALSPFALMLRGRYTRFVGSEYASTAELKEWLFPIRSEDIMALSFPDGAFDCVVCNEVFEHIPYLDRGIGEIARVLKPGASLIATFPFASQQQNGIVKARMQNGKVQFLMEPECHENPMDPQHGSLVFEVPGWNILDRCRSQGFSHAEIVFTSSYSRGITATNLAGILSLHAVR